MQPAMLMDAPVRLNPRQFASKTFPLRQSHLSRLCGPFACPRAFFLEIKEHNDGLSLKEWRYPKTVRGSVIHSVIDTLHRENAWERMSFIYGKTWRDEMSRSDEPPINWKYDDKKAIIRDGFQMVKGYASDPRNREAKVIAQETSFVTEIAGKYIATGTVDQIRKIDGGYQLVDFKSGQIPSQEELNWSYQLALYSLAMLLGKFYKKKDTSESFELKEFPASLVFIKLSDYLPYERPSTKRITYLSEAKYYDSYIGHELKAPSKTNPNGHPLLCKGMPKGPVFYESLFDLDMIYQFERSISNAIATVRMNRWWHSNSTLACSRCPFRGPVCRDIVRESGRELADLTFKPIKKRSVIYDGSYVGSPC